MDDKPTIPDVLEKFVRYRRHKGWGAWGSLHIVLDDANTDAGCAKFCAEYAEQVGDTEGAELARILCRMSGTQRGKIGRMADEFIARQDKEKRS